MSFVRINGLAVPAMDGSVKTANQEIGSRERAFSGSLLTDRRARKRTWTMRTSPVTELVAKAIEGAIVGLGDSWAFDFSDTARLIQDLFSSKGAGPGSTVGSLRFGIGADGSTVVDGAGVIEAQYGNGSLTVEAAATNILLADQRDVEGVVSGSFVAVVGGVLSIETTTILQGGQSLKIVTSNANDGVETVAVTASGSTAYVASVYVKIASGSRNVQLLLSDDLGLLATKSVLITGPNWTRIEVTGTTAGGAADIRLRVRDTDAGGTTLFADAWQIETGAIATTWVDGTRANGTLEYPVSLITVATDLTYNFWVNFPTANTASQRVLIDARDSANGFNVCEVFRETGANDLRFFTNDATGANADSISHTSAFDGAWHMVTCVLRKNKEAGENSKELFFDGVSVGTSNPAGVPVLSRVTRLCVGQRTGSVHMVDGKMDDLQILPFAASSAQVTAWFNMGQAMSSLPRVFIDGDIMPDDELTILAEGTVQSSFMAAAIAGGFRSNLRQLDLTLQEV